MDLSIWIVDEPTEEDLTRARQRISDRNCVYVLYPIRLDAWNYVALTKEGAADVVEAHKAGILPCLPDPVFEPGQKSGGLPFESRIKPWDLASSTSDSFMAKIDELGAIEYRFSPQAIRVR